MKIEVAGKDYDNFIRASAEIRLDALSNTFLFEATSEDARPLPFKGGESCEISANGTKILDGFIEVVNVDGSAENHVIKIQGRDKTADLLDSSIADLSDLRAPITLKRIIELVIKDIGASIKVIDEVQPKPYNPSEDLAAPEPGENAFEFIEVLARKRQVLLTSNEDGDLVIAAGSGIFIPAFVQNRVRDSANNVLRYAVSYDSTGRFNVYRSVSQLNATTLNLLKILDFDSIVSQGVDKIIRDEEIREGRQMVTMSESNSSTAENERRATWEANIRKARGKVYSATVDGFRNQTGDLWRINRLVNVDDEYAGIKAKMLVNSVTFAMNEESGRTTTLSLVESNAYSLELDEPRTEELGLGLSF